MNRDGYQALLAAARSPKPPFDVILAESTDRLWRDMAEQQATLRRLRLNGIEVVSVSQGIASRSAGASTQFAVNGLVSQLWVDAIRAKTHRGLEALALRGMSTGGRTYGYKTVEGRIAIDEAEAAVVRRIYRDYAEGQSLPKIAHALNAEGIAPPLYGTRHGQTRKAWAVTSIRFILRSERYLGRIVWNRREFLKDPDSGKRRSVLRPEAEWRTEDRPDLRIVPPELEQAVAARIKMLVERYDAGRTGNRPGRSSAAYSRRYLLTGMLRCGTCNARMIADTTIRRKPSGTYQQAWYYCPVSRSKGETVCSHRTRYRKDVIESRLQTRAGEAMTRKNIGALMASVNAALKRHAERATGRDEELSRAVTTATAERDRWLAAIGSGADTFASVREKLAAVESEIASLTADLERARFEKRAARMPTTIRPEWVRGYLRGLRRAVKQDVPKAKAMILGLLDGDLV